MQARSTAPGWRSVARQNPRAGALRLTVRCQIVGVTRCASPNSCGKSSSQSADCRSPVTNSSRDLPRRGNKKNPAQIRQPIHPGLNPGQAMNTQMVRCGSQTMANAFDLYSVLPKLSSRLGRSSVHLRVRRESTVLSALNASFFYSAANRRRRMS